MGYLGCARQRKRNSQTGERQAFLMQLVLLNLNSIKISFYISQNLTDRCVTNYLSTLAMKSNYTDNYCWIYSKIWPISFLVLKSSYFSQKKKKPNFSRYAKVIYSLFLPYRTYWILIVCAYFCVATHKTALKIQVTAICLRSVVSGFLLLALKLFFMNL